jgi:predicted DNA-binding protein
MNEIRFELTQENIEALDVYSKLLNKETSTIFNEALELYFEKAQEHLETQSLDGNRANTNLGFDEFWDGVDI